MLKEFNKNFGISTSIEQEKIAFTNRCAHFFSELRYKVITDDEYNSLFEAVCIQLGQNPGKLIHDNSFLRHYVPELVDILPNDFLGLLKIITATRKYFSKQREAIATTIDEFIEGFLSMSTTDMAISYKLGMFFPKGDELLDKELISVSLTSLTQYPSENKDLQNALDNYRTGTGYGVIENCYRCIEGLSRLILKNNKTLIDNKQEIIKASGLSDHWKRILANYIEYGNEFGRHASRNRHEFNEAEVEAFLYTTCLLIRLIIKLQNIV